MRFFLNGMWYNNIHKSMKKFNKKSLRGFTLIELLVVIAIVAVLATAVVVVLNPAQLVAQGRDSNRISDLSAINSAIALYLSDYDSASFTSTAVCTATSTGGAHPATMTTSTVSTSTVVTGTGWVGVDFTDISAGSPLSRLPLDPTNSSTYHYCFRKTTSLTYEIDANMESTKYQSKESEDGGNNSIWYEVGNLLTL